jgi:REP element-mobilizing transposase RayT
LKGYDYSQAGLYFITICCYKRECLFGDVVNGEMVLNEFGTIASNEWLNTPNIRKNVELDVFVIMPNHFHGIIILNGRGELHSPENIIADNVITDNVIAENIITDNIIADNVITDKIITHNIITENIIADNKSGECNSPLRGPSNNIGAIVRGYKSSVTKQLNLLNIGCTVWQRNYHEHVIRNEKSYQTIAQYIVNNPLKWNDDKFYIK